ncbi:hypothetical protein BDR26DRAFT_931371 [Obelidium mucronatum]|nr:hypothetical protein BDR26DRAFT_931371 [Obelidium mucronatum]
MRLRIDRVVTAIAILGSIARGVNQHNNPLDLKHHVQKDWEKARKESAWGRAAKEQDAGSSVHTPEDGPSSDHSYLDPKHYAQEEWRRAGKQHKPTREPEIDQLIQQFESEKLGGGMRLGSHIRTRVLIDGSDNWALCDTGAQLSILNETWAAENGIKKVATAAMTVTGFDNVPRKTDMAISQPVTFTNFNGHNPNEILTLGTDVMPNLGIGLTGLSAAGDTPLPTPFKSEPTPAVEFPEAEESEEDRQNRENLMKDIQPFLDENGFYHGRRQTSREP